LAEFRGHPNEGVVLLARGADVQHLSEQLRRLLVGQCGRCWSCDGAMCWGSPEAG
jgi:hypothetical protein